MLRNLAAGLVAFALVIMLIGAWPIIQQRLEFKDHARVDVQRTIQKVPDPNNPHDLKSRILKSEWVYEFDGKKYSNPDNALSGVNLLRYNDQLDIGKTVEIPAVALVDPGKPDQLVWPPRYTFLQYWLVLFPLPLLVLGLIGVLYKEPGGYTDVPMPRIGLYELQPQYGHWYRRVAVLALAVLWALIAGVAGYDYFVDGSKDNQVAGGIVFALYFIVGVAFIGYALFVWWADMRIRSAKVVITRCPMLIGVPVDITSEWQFARGMRLASVRMGLVGYAVRRQKRGKWGVTMRQLGESIAHEWNEVLVNKRVKGGEHLKLQRTFIVPPDGKASSRRDQKEEPVYVWFVATHLTFADGPDWERLYPVYVKHDSRVKVAKKTRSDGATQMEDN